MAGESLSLPIDAIKLGERHRKDLGDIKRLAQSIADVGLLHPVVVTAGSTLIAGERRIAACRHLGWPSVPVTIVDLQEIVRGEFAENAIRKDFVPSEIAAIWRAIEPIEKAAAKERMSEGGKGRKVSGPSDTRDKIGAFAGVSGRTLEKILQLVDAAELDPDRFSDLVAKMDRTGKVDGVFKELTRRRREDAESQAIEAADRSMFTISRAAVAELDWIADNSVDAIITDPPYPQKFLPVYSELSKTAARILRPGGSCFVMIGQSYLPEILSRLAKYLTYNWCLAYLTPGGQAVQLWNRKVNTFWKPVLWLTKGDYAGDWIGDVRKSDPNDNDKRFHHWGQSESGMADLIRSVSKPGDLICDPFLGGGTTAVVSLDLGRRFVGSDIDQACVDRALARLGAEISHAA